MASLACLVLERIKTPCRLEKTTLLQAVKDHNVFFMVSWKENSETYGGLEKALIKTKDLKNQGHLVDLNLIHPDQVELEKVRDLH